MISVLSFGLFWIVVTLFLFDGPWKDFGNEHPYIMVFIVLFGGLIVGNLLTLL